MIGKNLLLSTLALLVFAFTSWYVPPCFGHAPPTIEAELQRYHISLSPESLQPALKDSRPAVRSLAAGELAEIKDMTSVPALTQAVQSEQDRYVQLNMAAALVSLGSPNGIGAL